MRTMRADASLGERAALTAGADAGTGTLTAGRRDAAAAEQATAISVTSNNARRLSARFAERLIESLEREGDFAVVVCR